MCDVRVECDETGKEARPESVRCVRCGEVEVRGRRGMVQERAGLEGETEQSMLL